MDLKKTSLKFEVFISAVLFTVLFSTSGMGQAAVKRICIVAVHDSSLFTLCPPKLSDALASGMLGKLPPIGDPWYSEIWNHAFDFKRYGMCVRWDGNLCARSASYTLARVPAPLFLKQNSVLERGRPDWEELSNLVDGVTPSGWLDPSAAKEVESEISKNREYRLVNSPKDADLVFLLESIYKCYGSPDGTRINYGLTDDGSGWGNQLSLAAIAIVVPADIYRENPANAAALLAARSWAGVHLYRIAPLSNGVRGLPQGSIGGTPVADGTPLVRSASPKEVAKRFLKNAKWPQEIPPIAPAWIMTPLAAVRKAVSRPDQSIIPEKSVPTSNPVQSGGNLTFRANTTLVSIPVIARDADGRCISGLEVGDFRVYENGVEQKIKTFVSEPAPFHAALMVDISHSTNPALSDISSGAYAFISQLRPADDLIILSFTNKIYMESEFTNNKFAMRSAVAQIRNHTGGRAYYGDDMERRMLDYTWSMGTRLYDALDLAITERFDRLTGRKAIVLFTDGIDSGSRLANLHSSLARIEESSVLMYVIQYETPMLKGINRETNAGMFEAHKQGAEYLQQLAEHSGGRIFNASTDAAYKEAFSIITEEMGHQYTLFYYPKETTTNSRFRRIQVTTDRPGVKISARAGYRPAVGN